MSDTTPQQMADARLDSFLGLFLCEQRRLYQFTVTLLGNTVDADDVFQETSLAIWSAFDQFTAWHRLLRLGKADCLSSDPAPSGQHNRGVRYLDPDVLELVAVEVGFRIVSPKFQLPHCSIV